MEFCKTSIALTLSLLLLGVSHHALFAAGNPGDVTVDNFPETLQLYPRDPISNTATVLVSGSVENGSDYTNIKVLVERDGSYFADPSLTLDYSNGDAPFSFSILITAELEDYSFELIATDNSGDASITSADDVVAGDVYLINGQSNANARKRTGSNFVGLNAGNYFYIRSFGRRETCFPGPSCNGTSITPFNADWYVANSDNDAGKGAIGQWGALLARDLIDGYGIPVAILSNAVSNTSIDQHQPAYTGYSNPYSQIPFNNIYQRLLWRVQNAGLDQHVRAIIWHQGESDSGNSAGHESGFKNLYTAWQQDYPDVEHVYAHQIRNISADCGNGADMAVREVQRRMIDDPYYSNLQVMSTTAIDAQIEDCHYPHASIEELDAQGEIAEHIFNLMARDLYGSTDTQNIDAPNIDFAYYTDASKQIVNMVMRDLDDTLVFASGAEDDFQIEGTSAAVTAGSVAENVVSVTLANSAAGASGISYVGHVGVDLKDVQHSDWMTAEPRWGEWVTNAKGVGMLAFQNVPIAEDLPAIAITNPITGSVMDFGQPITIQYTATDTDGLQEVSLYANSLLITTTVWSTNPVSMTNNILWSPPMTGTYTFTASALDVMNARSTATPVTIEINTPPTITIVDPINGSVFPSNSTVTIQANPQDVDGVIASTSFYIGTTPLTNTILSAPWEYIWINAPSGTHNLTAVTEDDDGSSTTSGVVTIRVNEPPTVTLLSPLSGSVFIAGTTPPLLGALPVDSDGTITAVEFYDGASLLTTLSTAPWTFDWTAAPVGVHSLTAKTVDNDGEMAVSAPVNIEVLMPTPTPTLTPTNTPTPIPTDTPTPVPTDTPTPIPTDTPTPVPTDTPTPVPTDTPTPIPTDTPTPAPMNTPTAVPTDGPTSVPTDAATAVPTGVATAVPTNASTTVPMDTPMPTSATATPTTTVSTNTGPKLALASNTMTGAPESKFVILGTGFPPNASISLELNGKALGSYDTNDDGQLILVIKTLAEIPLGAYSVTANQYNGVSTAFIVDAAANVLTPISGGSEVTIPLSKPAEGTTFLPFVTR